MSLSSNNEILQAILQDDVDCLIEYLTPAINKFEGDFGSAIVELTKYAHQARSYRVLKQLLESWCQIRIINVSTDLSFIRYMIEEMKTLYSAREEILLAIELNEPALVDYFLPRVYLTSVYLKTAFIYKRYDIAVYLIEKGCQATNNCIEAALDTKDFYLIRLSHFSNQNLFHCYQGSAGIKSCIYCKYNTIEDLFESYNGTMITYIDWIPGELVDMLKELLIQ